MSMGWALGRFNAVKLSSNRASSKGDSEETASGAEGKWSVQCLRGQVKKSLPWGGSNELWQLTGGFWWGLTFGFSNMEGIGNTDKHKFGGVSASKSWWEWVCVKRGEKMEAVRLGHLSKRLRFQDIYWFISHNDRFQQENHMINPINVEKTSDLTKLNVHSNSIFNKLNTRVSILLLLSFSHYIVSDSPRLHGQSSLSFTISQSLLRLMSIDSVMPSNHLILCHPPTSPALNLSHHQALFQWVGSSHEVAKVLELQLQHQSFQRIFRVDFL